MSRHTATVTWQLGPQEDFADFEDFAKGRYSRRHLWRFDGGQQVAASSSPHVVPLPWPDAQAVDPEEAFVASLASCHMLWFLSIAAHQGFAVQHYEDRASGVMAQNAQGKPWVSVVTLAPAVHFAGRQPSFKNLFKTPARRAVKRIWAVCGVAKPCHSPSYGCVLRLASHPKPLVAHSRRDLEQALRSCWPCTTRPTKNASLPSR